MKKCIWCLNDESDVPFEKESHIIPQNLGSKDICIDVCDPCNEFFGAKTERFKPSIDVALKEILVLSKYQRLGSVISIQNQIGKEKTKEFIGQYIGKNVIQTLNRNTEFFIIEERNGQIEFKTTNAFRHHFYNPSILTNRLKRGLFKVGFETAYNEGILGRNCKPFLDSFYEYVRDYVRWDKGNLKMYYLQRKVGAELMNLNYSIAPKVLMHGIDKGYLKFEILGHTFGISIGQSNFTEHLFLRKYQKNDSLFKPVELRKFLDIDVFNRIYKK